MRDLKAAPQRGLLIVNPKASTGSRRRTRWVVKKLDQVLDLTVQKTEGRGHGEELARRGADAGYDVVLSLGGDGTVNEVVNGLVADGRPAEEAPVFAPIPAGSTNVFARALGLPWDRRRASMAIVSALVDSPRTRTVSLGRAQGKGSTGCSRSAPGSAGTRRSSRRSSRTARSAISARTTPAPSWRN
nr:hypothetical protein GCM10025732_19040 [Glycomyces mayteni]